MRHGTVSACKAPFSSVRAAFKQIPVCWWRLWYGIFFPFCFVSSLSSGRAEVITSFPEDVQIAMVASSGSIVHIMYDVMMTMTLHHMYDVMMTFSAFSVQVRSQNLAYFASLHWQRIEISLFALLFGLPVS